MGNAVKWCVRVFAGEFGWVSFLVVCFLYETDPNARKVHCCGENVAQNATFLTHFFLGLRSFVGFILTCVCFLTQQNLVNRKHPNYVRSGTSTLVVTARKIVTLQHPQRCAHRYAIAAHHTPRCFSPIPGGNPDKRAMHTRLWEYSRPHLPPTAAPFSEKLVSENRTARCVVLTYSKYTACGVSNAFFFPFFFFDPPISDQVSAAGFRCPGCVLVPHVGGHRHGRAEDVGHSVRRAERSQSKSLVRYGTVPSWSFFFFFFCWLYFNACGVNKACVQCIMPRVFSLFFIEP